MTVEELIEDFRRRGIPWTAEVVVPGSDHSYRRITRGGLAQAEEAGGDLYEFDERGSEGPPKAVVLV